MPCDVKWATAKVQVTSLRLLLLLLAESHALVPLALSNAGLVVRRSRLDILHHAFDGSAGLVSVAVHCVARRPWLVIFACSLEDKGI